MTTTSVEIELKVKWNNPTQTLTQVLSNSWKIEFGKLFYVTTWTFGMSAPFDTRHGSAPPFHVSKTYQKDAETNKKDDQRL